MPVDVLTSIEIEASVAEVSAFAADPDNAPAWYDNIRSVAWVSERPLQLGSRLDFVAHFLGKPMAYTYEVVDYQPGERLVMRTAQGPFPMETTYTWEEPRPGVTTMTLRNRGEPSGFAALFMPFMSFAMQRANTKDLRAIKAILEV